MTGDEWRSDEHKIGGKYIWSDRPANETSCFCIYLVWRRGLSDDVREMERLHTRQIWVYTMEERERHFVTCWLTVCCSFTLALSWWWRDRLVCVCVRSLSMMIESDTLHTLCRQWEIRARQSLAVVNAITLSAKHTKYTHTMHFIVCITLRHLKQRQWTLFLHQWLLR